MPNAISPQLLTSHKLYFEFTSQTQSIAHASSSLFSGRIPELEWAAEIEPIVTPQVVWLAGVPVVDVSPIAACKGWNVSADEFNCGSSIFEETKAVPLTDTLRQIIFCVLESCWSSTTALNMPYQFGHAQGSPSNTGKLSIGSEVITAEQTVRNPQFFLC